MNKQGPRTYRFDGIEIDAPKLRLICDGDEKHLRQKTFQVLVYLVEHADRLISKDELIEKIWQGAAVSDNTLEQCLAEIRRVLGDDSRRPRFIKTVQRGGYRFIGEIQEVKAEETVAPEVVITRPSSEPNARPSTQTTGRFARRRVLIAGAILVLATIVFGSVYVIRKRTHNETLVGATLGQDPARRPVAVMFFENESGNADLDWLREGLADMIITDLSRSNNLAVLSRQELHVLLDRIGHPPAEKITLQEALNIAKQTQAKLLVLGSFAKLGGQIRIDVHLHDARDGQLLTAERLIVDEPAQILTQVDLLSLKLGAYMGAPPQGDPNAGLATVLTNNLEAFRYYSLGVEKAQVLRNEEALALLQKAVALDANFAMAYARIGYVYGITGNSPDRAKPYLEKAFHFTDHLTPKDKLQIQAWYAIVNFDYAAAIDALRRIIAAYPLEVEAYLRLARLLMGEEKSPEAIEVLKQGLVMDPGYKEFYNTLGNVYSETGRHDEAIAMYQRYVQLAPEEPNSHDSLGLGYQWAGRYDEAIQEFGRALQLKPDFYIARVHLANSYFQLGRYGAATEEYQRYIKAGSEDERLRGNACLAYVALKKHNLNQAERFAPRQSTPFSFHYLVALERDDLQGAGKIKEMIERGVGNERGLRNSQRPLWYVRGLYALKSGSAEEAIDDFKQALSHRPQIWNIDTFEDCLANAYAELGRFDAAIAEYQRILKLNPNYPLIHYHLAQAYERRGEQEQARFEYERFLQVWKDADADILEVTTARKAATP